MKSLQLMQQSQQKQSETIKSMEDEIKKNKTNIDKQFKTISENTKNIPKPHLNDYEHIRKTLIDRKLYSDNKMKSTWPFFLKSTGESLSEKINTINNTLETLETNFDSKTKTDTTKIKKLEKKINQLEEQLKNTQENNHEILEKYQKIKQERKTEKKEQESKEKLLIAKIINQIINKGHDINITKNKNTHEDQQTTQKETKRQSRSWGSSSDSDSSDNQQKKKKKKKQKKSEKQKTNKSSSSDTFSDEDTFRKIKSHKALWTYDNDENDRIFREFYLRIRAMKNPEKTANTRKTYQAIRHGRFNQEEQRDALKAWASTLDDEEIKEHQMEKLDKYVKKLMQINTELRNTHDINDD